MAPRSKQQTTAIMIQLWAAARTKRIQHQYNNGSAVLSPKRRKNRRSHPPEPKPESIPSETKANKNAFTKQIPMTIQFMDNNAKKADSRKGIKAAFIRPTIDTGHKTALRITENVSGEETEKKATPHRRPQIQQHARTSGISLRVSQYVQNGFLRTANEPPYAEDRHKKLAYEKRERYAAKDKSFRKTCLHILYSISYRNSSFFSQKCFFCKL